MDILIYGTINSISLALYALGFALVYGISRLPNFAHGALYVLSGFIAWNPYPANIIIVCYAVLSNTPCILNLRYTRRRMNRLLHQITTP